MSVEEHDWGTHMLSIGVFTIVPLFTVVTRVEGYEANVVSLCTNSPPFRGLRVDIWI